MSVAVSGLELGTAPMSERITSIDIVAPILGGVIAGILYDRVKNASLILILLSFMIAYFKPTPFTYGVALGMLSYGLYRFIKDRVKISVSE